MASQVVLILDFGGQYNQLIARRVREANVYCEVKPCTTPLSELMKYNPIGFIFTGGPQSVYPEDRHPRAADSRHLLRLSADRPPSGRQGHCRTGRYRARIRQN